MTRVHNNKLPPPPARRGDGKLQPVYATAFAPCDAVPGKENANVCGGQLPAVGADRPEPRQRLRSGWKGVGGRRAENVTFHKRNKLFGGSVVAGTVQARRNDNDWGTFFSRCDARAA
ncbi:hypothetical protein EYF80_004901 [Liparis tanakae]|uniref:Uncharacterized protein n=1 Tax=Liparis tanakae TaxID=230148 RepID=A0A4Z2J3T3_9TELE|nr:hypothetical protein EYF80_004901 [Liparis tanakae]